MDPGRNPQGILKKLWTDKKKSVPYWKLWDAAKPALSGEFIGSLLILEKIKDFNIII